MESVANYVLMNVSPVVDLVFSYLSGKSLSNAAQVCTSWCAATRREWKKRKWWHIELLQCSNAWDDIQINRQVKLMFDNMKLKPSLLLALQSSHYETDDEILLNIKKYIPHKCILLTSNVGGVIGKHYGTETKTLELEYKNAISILCLKPSMDLKFKSFIIRQSRINKLKSKDVDIVDMVNLNLSPETSAVLLLFATSGMKIRNVISRIKKNPAKRKLVVIGGYTDSVCDSSEEFYKGLMGIIFYGENINSALYIHSDDSSENLIAGLSNMKDKITDRSNGKVNWGKSFMFMVSCVGRGEAYYNGKKNIETSAVDRVFPGMHTFGFFGFGEIGFDSADPEQHKCCNFSLTSVFCVINYG